MTQQRTPSRHLRAALAATGAVAGLAAWFLADRLGRGTVDPRLYLFLSAWAFGFFAPLLALAGPVRPLACLPAAAALATGAAGLLWSASFRHDTVDGYLALGYPLAAYGLLLVIATPFAAAGLRSRRLWRDYPTLFELSWRILVRFASALIFTALFWGLVLLSDSLLQLVGLDLIGWIQRAEVAPWLLTGAVFGLALAVTHELRDYLSPFLLLRLLRLFLPVVLVVVALFLALLPVQGLSELVGDLSAAGTLLGAALTATVLVTVAVDRDPAEEAAAGWLRRAVQALALLLPVLGALALYALALRVGQYGWTPARLMAAATGGVLTLYGLAYAAAVLRGADWTARIRQANVALALVILALSALWLSPALVPERIAAQSQLARFRAGAMPAEDLGVEQIARDWGRPGRAALAALEADPDLAARIAAARRAAPAGPLRGGADLRADLARMLPVDGGSLDVAMLAGYDDAQLQDWSAACARRVANGPGCRLVLAEFVPGEGVTRGVLFLNTGGALSVEALALRDGRLATEGYTIDAAPGPAYGLPLSVLEALHRGEGRVEPSGFRALRIGDHAFFPEN